MTKRATVLMSGGIDSAACASFVLAQGLDASAIFVDYGQAAAPYERIAANALAKHLGLDIQELTLKGCKAFGAGELVGRNAFMIFSALFATRGASSILALGLHAGTPYYDCSEAFLDATDCMVGEQTEGKVRLMAPFISWRKNEVYEYFKSTGLPISQTYSCEAGTRPACKKCASCLDRKALGC